MPGISRRRFLRAAGTGAGALLGARMFAALGAGAALGGVVAARPAVATQPFSRPLWIPPELTDAEISLVAQVADVPLLPGAPTRMWTFDGTFPGPTIRRPAGERTEVTVVHDLPDEVGSLNIHNHGNHSASEHDGVFPVSAIEPGGSHTYVYELTEAGEPARGRMQWYHDHTHHRTGRNVWMGLAGLFIVDDPAEDALGLPSGPHDIPLVIVDRRFDDGNQLPDAFTAPDKHDTGPLQGLGAGWPPSDEPPGIGDRMLVNGVVEPYLEVEARRYRLRVLNASNFSPINLRLSNGAPLVQIATESGLLPAPIVREAVMLGPAERAEVVVDFAGMLGEDIVLRSEPATPDPLLPVPGSPARPRAGAKLAEIMQIRVVAGPEQVDDSRVPEVLRPAPDWVAEAPEIPDRVFAFSVGVDEHGHTAWVINGRAFDHERVEARPELDSIETWALINAGHISHYVHLHAVDWTVVSRNNAPPAAYEAGLKETFRLDPGEVLLVAAKFTEHTGRFVAHCHMLEHEDHGMMMTFEVVEPGEGDRPLTALPLPLLVEASVAGAAERTRVGRIVRSARGGDPAPVVAAGGTALARGPSPYACEL